METGADSSEGLSLRGFIGRVWLPDSWVWTANVVCPGSHRDDAAESPSTVATAAASIRA
jgi:hypothetical protein